MTGTWLKRGALVLIAAAIVYGAWAMLQPQPVAVDLAAVTRGAIEKTIDEEGETRVRDIYRISAPTAGKLERLTVQVGDRIMKDQRIARIRPVDPPMRDIRTQSELIAATKAAEAAVELARAEVSKAESALVFARSDLGRAQRLAANRTISTKALEQAELEVKVKTAQVAEARSTLELRKHELESARARERQRFDNNGSKSDADCCTAVDSPVSGTVLKLISESAQVVAAGKELVEVGDLRNLEIVVDLLSADAVAIRPGTPARIFGWGGEGTLNAKVRRVDPAGFTKVSALGIEEQRVNVVLDITDDMEKWKQLGHAYRVIVRIVTARREDVPLVPLSALFRNGEDWATYVVNDGVAHTVTIEPGLFGENLVEVVKGLKQGDRVILYPSDQVKEGTVVVPREG